MSTTYPPIQIIKGIGLREVTILHNGQAIGTANCIEFHHLRAQIKRAKATGYAVKFENGSVCNVESDGTIKRWPGQTEFDVYGQILDYLIGADQDGDKLPMEP